MPPPTTTGTRNSESSSTRPARSARSGEGRAADAEVARGGLLEAADGFGVELALQAGPRRRTPSSVREYTILSAARQRRAKSRGDRRWLVSPRLPEGHRLVHPAPVEVRPDRALEVVHERVHLVVGRRPAEAAVAVGHVAVERRDRGVDQPRHDSTAARSSAISASSRATRSSSGSAGARRTLRPRARLRRRRRAAGRSAPPSGPAAARAAGRARARRAASSAASSSSPEPNAYSRSTRWRSSPGVCGPRSISTASSESSAGESRERLVEQVPVLDRAAAGAAREPRPAPPREPVERRAGSSSRPTRRPGRGSSTGCTRARSAFSDSG